jgi:hypothetical protein
MRELTITQFATEYGCSRVNVYKRLMRKTLDFEHKVVGKMIIILVPIKIKLSDIQSVRRKK